MKQVILYKYAGSSGSISSPVGCVELDKRKYDYRAFIDFMILTASAIFTARNEVGARLCFYRCV